MRWKVTVFALVLAFLGLVLTIAGSTAAMEFLLAINKSEQRNVWTALAITAAVVFATGGFARWRAARHEES